MNERKLSVALVHDYLTTFGGAERVLYLLSKMYPHAPIYTLLYDKKKFEGLIDPARVHPSFVQSFPRFIRTRHKLLLPLLPTAVETFDLRAYDLVISSSGAFAKGVITKPEAVHVSYCHSPMRFAWDWYHNYLEEQKLGFFKRTVAVTAMNIVRMWDRQAAERVDYFIANSHTTAKRIAAYYLRNSKVIYPPVDVARFPFPNKSAGYFLLVSRLVPYKRIDIVVKAFNKLKFPLLIIGEGSEFGHLQAIANSNVKMLGFQPDEKVKAYLANCEAFIFAAEDDFGIAPVEAMACGKPVLAFRRGGATETMIEGVTGEFFDYPMEELIADGVRRMWNKRASYNPQVIHDHAQQFSSERFMTEFSDMIERVTKTIGSQKLS